MQMSNSDNVTKYADKRTDSWEISVFTECHWCHFLIFLFLREDGGEGGAELVLLSGFFTQLITSREDDSLPFNLLPACFVPIASVLFYTFGYSF